MPNQSSAKGNPASTRMSNKRKKETRLACYLRGEKRKAARREAQEKQAKVNKGLRESGLLTAWQEAIVARIERRNQDPKIIARRVKIERQRAEFALAIQGKSVVSLDTAAQS